MFDSRRATGGGDIPSFQWNVFDPSQAFQIPSCGDVEVTPLPVEHGNYFSEEGIGQPYMCMGFRIGPVAYVSDASRIGEETRMKIGGCRVLILDALREVPHASHFSFSEVRDPPLFRGTPNLIVFFIFGYSLSYGADDCRPRSLS
jgi:phosphoribosyl 1,2-cyclic phosphodiesterase